MAEMMTVEELAERWKMGTAWVRHLIRTGTLPARQAGDGWLIDPRHVREYEARQYERRHVYTPGGSKPPKSINPG